MSNQHDTLLDHPPFRARPAALTIRQACDYAGLSRSFIYSLFEQKALPRLKAGKRVLVLRSDLDAYLESIREERA